MPSWAPAAPREELQRRGSLSDLGEHPKSGHRDITPPVPARRPIPDAEGANRLSRDAVVNGIAGIRKPLILLLL